MITTVFKVNRRGLIHFRHTVQCFSINVFVIRERLQLNVLLCKPRESDGKDANANIPLSGAHRKLPEKQELLCWWINFAHEIHRTWQKLLFSVIDTETNTVAELRLPVGNQPGMV